MGAASKSRMASLQFEITEQRRHEPVYGGGNYGKGVILVDGSSARLFYVPGHTIYLNSFNGSGYFPSHLYLARDTQVLSRRHALQLQCKRLSAKLLRLPEVRKAVASEWGEAVAAALDPKKTIVVEARSRRASYGK